MKKFWFSFRPKSLRLVTSNQYSLIVFDPFDQPFSPLTEFYKEEVGRISQSSTLSYLYTLLPFFDWLSASSNFKGARILWNDPSDVIRVAVKQYLVEKGACKVITHRDGYQLIKHSSLSPGTLKCYLAALRAFYNCMIRLGMYIGTNPMIEGNLSIILNQENLPKSARNGLPRLPYDAGTETPSSYRAYTDSYFKFADDKWRPYIIDDVTLPDQIFAGGQQVKWKLRDELIARILFQSGARASEVVNVTIGDYRQRSSVREMSTFNKGSNGRRVKFLYFNDDTAKLLRRYINGERRRYDPSKLSYDNLPDDAPLFLSAQGNPYTYHAWYANWKKACKSVGLDVNPHKTRHWYVTQMLRIIHEESKSDGETQRRIQELILYMKWRSKETITVYEHHYQERKHEEVQQLLYKKLEKLKHDYIRNADKKQPKHSNKLDTRKTPVEQLDQDLLDWLTELE